MALDVAAASINPAVSPSIRVGIKAAVKEESTNKPAIGANLRLLLIRPPVALPGKKNRKVREYSRDF